MLSDGKVRAARAISSLAHSCWCKFCVTAVGGFTVRGQCCQGRTGLGKLRKNQISYKVKG